MRYSLILCFALPSAVHACSGPHVEEIILRSARIAAAGLSLCLMIFAITLIWSWRRKVPNWLPVATAFLAGINPYWFDHGESGDCGSTIMTLSPLLTAISGVVSISVWARYRKRS